MKHFKIYFKLANGQNKIIKLKENNLINTIYLCNVYKLTFWKVVYIYIFKIGTISILLVFMTLKVKKL